MFKKTFLLILILFISAGVSTSQARPARAGTTYYVSSSSGDDGDSGLTPTDAFASIAHVNGLSLAAGDSVLFFCGDTWRAEMLNPTDSGSAGNRITYGSYPADCANKPVLSGSQPISGWALDSGNIYVADLDLGGNSGLFPNGINQLFENNQRLLNGRWPNIDANADGGYARIDSVGGGGAQITDSELPNVDWSGATAHIKGMRWYLLIRDVTNDSGDTLTLNTAPDCYAGGCAGWGYFLNNHYATLDQDGEWFYDASTNEVYLYSTSGAPTNIEGSVILTTDDRAWGAITLGTDLFAELNYVTIENFDIRNWYRNGISTPTNYQSDMPSYITIQDNAITNVDRTGIHLAVWIWDNQGGGNPTGWMGGNNLLIDNNTIDGANHMGIDSYAEHSTFTNNTITNIALIENFNEDGMGCPHDSGGGFCTEDGEGIRIKTHNTTTSGNNNTLQGNRLDRIGGNGIGIYGHTNNILNNVVIEACYAKGDCGAISSYGSYPLGTSIVHDLLIQNNIIVDVIGNTDGAHATYAAVFGFGLYIDQYSRDVISDGNTVTGVVSHGILYQNSTGQITNNTLYNNASQTQWMSQLLITGSPTVVTPLTGNILYGLQTDTWTLTYSDSASLTNSNNNYFFQPYRPDHIRRFGDESDLTEWQNDTGMDANSVENWFTLSGGDDPLSKIFYNDTNAAKDFDLGDRQYLDLDQNTVIGSITLQPYTAQVLVDNGPLPLTLTGINPAMIADGAPEFTLTLIGTGFTASSVARWNGADRPTGFVSSTMLTATISAADVAAINTFPVTVFDGIETSAATFYVVDEVWDLFLPVVVR